MINALISVYYPSASVMDNVRAIAAQADRVFICDNSPDSHAGMFDRIDHRHNICYVCFHENLGLSRAFNRILQSPEYSWQEEDYVLFFDQDSHIEQAHIRQLIAIFETVRAGGSRIGCLGPVYFNTSSGIVETPKMKRELRDQTYAVSSIITSSMLSTFGILREVGFWNERVFLDLADWDLCWRIQAAGMLCCMTEKVVLHHSLGSGEKKFGPLKLRVGQPFREYYQIRDGLHLLGRSYTPFKYRIRFLATILIRSPLHLLLLDERKQRFHYILKGMADFFRGKSGALDMHRQVSE